MAERGTSNYIKLGNYEYNPADVLGSGAFAIVYKGRCRDKRDQKVAIKQMIKGQNVLKSKNLLSKEIAVLRDLNHEHIVRLFDHSISNAEVYLVIEFCNGGDLSEYLHCKKILPEETIKHFLIQIGSAMDAMNKRAIMHRDLKPGNILLSYYGDFTAVAEVPGHLISFKLADFGFARFLRDGIMAETMCGSPMYMAPEVLMCRKYDARADIWSMGIIVYQCFVGKAPFYANSPEALKNIYEKTADLKPNIPHGTSPYLRDLLLKMLIRKPADRIDFPAFLTHPFLQLKHFSPADLVPNKPASVPPLPGSIRKGFTSASGSGNIAQRLSYQPYGKHPTNRTYDTPPLLNRNVSKLPTKSRDPNASKIAALMPSYLQRPASSRITPPTQPQLPLSVRRPPGSQLPVAPSAKQQVHQILSPQQPMCGDYAQAHAPQAPYESQTTDTSGASSTPTDEPSDDFIEDHGLGGSSFLFDRNRIRGHSQDNRVELSTSGYADLDHWLAEVVHPPREASTGAGSHREPGGIPVASEMTAPCYSQQLQQQLRGDGAQLDGFIIVNADGSEIPHTGFAGPISTPIARRDKPPADWTPATATVDANRLPVTAGSLISPSFRLPPRQGSPMSGGPGQKFPTATENLTAEVQTAPRSPVAQAHYTDAGETTRVTEPRDVSGTRLSERLVHQTANAGDVYEKQVTGSPADVARLSEHQHRQSTGNSPQQAVLTADMVNIRASSESAEENLMEPEHTEEVKTITMVLELCELLTELAERRASALTDCTAATNTDADVSADEVVKGVVTGAQLSDSDTSSSTPKHKPTNKRLKLTSEAKRIVEQLVLYRRILYYLEYVYAQVKKAVDNKRLKPTAVAKRRVTDCNALYHRCYIRLCQLARQSRREDLIEPVGRLLSRITANRLIFNYALDQCYAAEMDDYIGELGLCLQRYRAAITLIYGLCQHANSPLDKTLLSDCLRLIHDRYSNLWNSAFGGSYTTGDAFAGTILPGQAPPGSLTGDPIISGVPNIGSMALENGVSLGPDMMPGLGDRTVAVGLRFPGAVVGNDVIRTAAITSALSSSLR